MAADVEIDGRRARAERGRSLFDLAAELGARVPTSCSGQGKCRECLVEVDAGAEHLSARTEEEDGLDAAFRLACRARVDADLGAVRCHTLRRGALRVETDFLGAGGELALDPALRRDGADIVRAGEVLERSDEPILGLAIDLGTTTVAVRLHDLEDGRLLGARSFENPQRFGGSDVLARIRFDTEHRGRLLQRVLLGYLTHAIEALPCDPRRIFEVVVAANTTMRDLFFGLDVRPIGELPYHSTTETEYRAGKRAGTSLRVAARTLRLPLHPRAEVYGLPLVSGHVGADAAACLLATGLGREDGLCVLMDIGTNTELVAGDRARLLAASCPAGPAFEGGPVRCGMPGLDGAIERVALDERGVASFAVIGGGAPAGICGSGLVDLLAELGRTERMNAVGRFTDGEGEFVVDAERRIALSEADVNELAQAKGANAAGLRVVLDRLGAQPRDIERFYLAGGFARHIDVAAARRIGLVPDLPDERFCKVGNAALQGASLALLSVSLREELEERVKTIEHVSLETHPRFFDFFVDGCQFVPLGDTP